MTEAEHTPRDADRMLAHIRAQHDPHADIWVFGYASLIWKPEFPFAEKRVARVYGWHRALKMWSRVYRGTPDCPGLVCGLLQGGSCQGVVFRIKAQQQHHVWQALWQREMLNATYDPRWLHCQTAQGPVKALAFTLHRRSPQHTGPLSDAQYLEVLARAQGRYGSSLDYARATVDELRRHNIRDRAMERLVRLATRLPSPG